MPIIQMRVIGALSFCKYVVTGHMTTFILMPEPITSRAAIIWKTSLTLAGSCLESSTMPTPTMTMAPAINPQKCFMFMSLTNL